MKKVGLLVIELAIMGARKNIWCILHWRTIHEQKRRRKRCFRMNYLILRQRQKLFLNLCFTLVKICREEKGRRKKYIAVYKEILDGSRGFRTFSMTNDLKLV